MTFEYVIEPLNKQHRRDSFSCGEPPLDLYLRQYARQSAEKGLGRTFVAVADGSADVVGYYTLSSGSISFADVPERLPRHPIPTAHIGRLAVDKKAQGRGLGSLLLADALGRVASVAAEIGIYAVELNAKSERAKRFYLRFGFVELIDDDKHLYLPINTIINAAGKASI